MNRPDDLRVALSSVCGADQVPEQIVVSDDTPSPSDAAVRQVAEEFQGVAYQKGARTGLSANRNRCLDNTNGDWILFIDDDVTVPIDFFVKVRDRLRDEDDMTLVTGTENKHLSDGVIVRVEPARVGFWGTQSGHHGGSPNAIVINATAFPKSLFAKGARFDEQLKYGCEEVDISRQATGMGYSITFESSWAVEHRPALTNRDAYQLLGGSSYLYATMKCYLVHKRSIAKFLLFASLGPPKMILHQTRQRGLSGLKLATSQSVTAFRMLIHSLRDKPAS